MVTSITGFWWNKVDVFLILALAYTNTFVAFGELEDGRALTVLFFHFLIPLPTFPTLQQNYKGKFLHFF